MLWKYNKSTKKYLLESHTCVPHLPLNNAYYTLLVLEWYEIILKWHHPSDSLCTLFFFWMHINVSLNMNSFQFEFLTFLHYI